MQKKLIISVLATLFTLYVFSIPPVEDGKMIFTARCASCHNVNKVIVGPALAGVSERRSEDWIIHFVHSSQTVIRGGDQTAVVLYEKFNKMTMPDHPDLTPENIKGILAYIKSETKTNSAAIAFRPAEMHPSYTPILLTDYRFFAGYLGLVLILAVSLLALVRVKEIQRKVKEEK
jgi:cytochrome c551/c552